ncbi:MAG: hypothetical protein J6B25_02450 [Clostridia bacterium]|nr:hypothetical protein [Clostridia bacterium]
MNQKMIRIIALVLAVLIAGSVLIAAVSSVAAADAATLALSTPHTGDDGIPKAPIIIGVVAIVLAIACAVIPKKSKK